MDRADALEFFHTLAQRLATQSNRITNNPIFMVQKLEKVVGLDENFVGDVEWVDQTSGDYVTFSDRDAAFAWHCERLGVTAEQLEERGIEEDDVLENDDLFKCYGFRNEWRHVMPFLTEAAAEQYLRINGHNLGRTRIYVEGGFRNQEWSDLREAVDVLFSGDLERLKTGEP